MQNHPNLSGTNNLVDATEGDEQPGTTGRTRERWQREAAELLERAAGLCVEHGVDLDAFVRGAWAFYVEARPGMRDYLEEIQLRSQIEELRAAGRVGEA